MIFGPTPLGEAEGAVLAHSVRLGSASFKKGRVLSRDDVTELHRAGVASVITARGEPGDMNEDDAAVAVASACVGPGVRANAPFTGRCNLFAERPGLVVFDPSRVDAVNLVDEAVTIATLPPFTPVSAGDMIATIKIIPFFAPRAVVTRCAALAADGSGLMRLAASKPLHAAMVLTMTQGMKPSVLDKTVEVTRARVEALGGTLAEERVIRCPHDQAAVAEAVAGLLATGCGLLMLSGASAIVDRRDIIPAAIVDADGTIDHFGMPVDPGNLILLAHHGDVPVVGLPGCARSPKLNGIDWLLQRLYAGIRVTGQDIMRMGAGGLLKDVPAARPMPRQAETALTHAAPARAPRIAAVLLAAGQSRRMGPVNKLLADVDGRPMVARAADALVTSAARPLVVVTGHEAERVRGALAGIEAEFVHNPDYADGLSTSLRRGLAAIPDDVDGALICLGDMPALSAAHVDRLIAAFDPVEGREICVPTFNGKRGNPVLWARRFFAEMTDVSGDVGARHLIGAHGDAVCEVQMPDSGVLIDLDTPEALARHRTAREA